MEESYHPPKKIFTTRPIADRRLAPRPSENIDLQNKPTMAFSSDKVVTSLTPSVYDKTSVTCTKPVQKTTIAPLETRALVLRKDGTISISPSILFPKSDTKVSKLPSFSLSSILPRTGASIKRSEVLGPVNNTTTSLKLEDGKSVVATTSAPLPRTTAASVPSIIYASHRGLELTNLQTETYSTVPVQGSSPIPALYSSATALHNVQTFASLSKSISTSKVVDSISSEGIILKSGDPLIEPETNKTKANVSGTLYLRKDQTVKANRGISVKWEPSTGQFETFLNKPKNAVFSGKSSALSLGKTTSRTNGSLVNFVDGGSGSKARTRTKKKKTCNKDLVSEKPREPVTWIAQTSSGFHSKQPTTLQIRPRISPTVSELLSLISASKRKTVVTTSKIGSNSSTINVDTNPSSTINVTNNLASSTVAVDTNVNRCLASSKVAMDTNRVANTTVSMDTDFDGGLAPNTISVSMDTNVNIESVSSMITMDNKAIVSNAETSSLTTSQSRMPLPITSVIMPSFGSLQLPTTSSSMMSPVPSEMISSASSVQSDTTDSFLTSQCSSSLATTSPSISTPESSPPSGLLYVKSILRPLVSVIPPDEEDKSLEENCDQESNRTPWQMGVTVDSSMALQAASATSLVQSVLTGQKKRRPLMINDTPNAKSSRRESSGSGSSSVGSAGSISMIMNEKDESTGLNTIHFIERGSETTCENDQAKNVITMAAKAIEAEVTTVHEKAILLNKDKNPSTELITNIPLTSVLSNIMEDEKKKYQKKTTTTTSNKQCVPTVTTSVRERKRPAILSRRKPVVQSKKTEIDLKKVPLKFNDSAIRYLKTEDVQKVTNNAKKCDSIYCSYCSKELHPATEENVQRHIRLYHGDAAWLYGEKWSRSYFKNEMDKKMMQLRESIKETQRLKRIARLNEKLEKGRIALEERERKAKKKSEINSTSQLSHQTDDESAFTTIVNENSTDAKRKSRTKPIMSKDSITLRRRVGSDYVSIFPPLSNSHQEAINELSTRSVIQAVSGSSDSAMFCQICCRLIEFSMEQHMDTFHTLGFKKKLYPHACHLCEETFPVMDALLEHVANKHTQMNETSHDTIYSEDTSHDMIYSEDI